MPVVTLILNTVNSAIVILELVLFWWRVNSHLIIVESKTCSDKKSGLSTLIGFHQKMQQPLNLQLCVFPLTKFWQQSIWEIKGAFLHADLTKNNLTKSLPYSESFVRFAPHVSCSNSSPSKLSKILLLAILFLIYSFLYF